MLLNFYPLTTLQLANEVKCSLAAIVRYAQIIIRVDTDLHIMKKNNQNDFNP